MWLAALALAISGCGGAATAKRTTTTAVTTTTTTAPPTTTTTAPPMSRVGDYGVATTAVTFSETTSSGARTLPVHLWYPTTPAQAGVSGGRPFPLVVFSPGYDIDVTPYVALLQDWASAGFVLAAVIYPKTDPAYGPVDESDILNHPADLRFVISSLLSSAQQPGSVLAGLVDASSIGIAGHSDGADVTLVVAHGSCCADARLKAAVVMSGSEEVAFGGNYAAGPAVPLLVVQGSADTINPPACGAQLYDSANSPKWYLDLLGAGHLPPLADAGTDQQVVARVVTDFFDGELKGQAAGLAAIAADGDVAGATQLTTGGQAPAAGGSCPGAPG